MTFCRFCHLKWSKQLQHLFTQWCWFVMCFFFLLLCEEVDRMWHNKARWNRHFVQDFEAIHQTDNGSSLWTTNVLIVVLQQSQKILTIARSNSHGKVACLQRLFPDMLSVFIGGKPLPQTSDQFCFLSMFCTEVCRTGETLWRSEKMVVNVSVVESSVSSFVFMKHEFFGSCAVVGLTFTWS